MDAPVSALGRLIVELKRRRVFRVAAMYAAAAFVVLQAADLVLPALLLPAWTFRLLVVVTLLGFPLALALAWAFDVTPAGLERTDSAGDDVASGGTRALLGAGGRRVLGYTGMAVLAAGAGWAGYGRLAESRAEEARSLAVLPFRNLSGQAETQYFSDGVTEEILTHLTRIAGLRVLAPAALRGFQVSSLTLAQAGSQLHVRSVLQGTVARDGDRVRITVELVDAGSGERLWANSYERELRNVFEIQSDVAEQVARELKLTLGPALRSRIEQRPTENLQAYDEYLRGRFYSAAVETESRYAAIPHFARAVELDSSFALAHAWLAHALTYQFFVTGQKDAEERAFVEVQRALELDPRLADAYLVRSQLAWTLPNGFPHERAVQDARRALDLNPGLATAHFQLAAIYMHVGLLDKALAEFRATLALDPSEVGASWRIGRVYWYQQRFADAVTAFEAVPEFRGNGELVLALWGAGRRDDARRRLGEMLQQSPGSGDLAGVAAVLAAAEGRADEAEVQIQKAIDGGKGTSHFHHAEYNIGTAYALLGRTPLAVDWLRRASEDGLPCYPLFAGDPNLARIRGDPEFKALLADIERRWRRYQATL